MKIAKVLSASILAGGILFSATACSVSNNDKPEVNTSAEEKSVDSNVADPKTTPGGGDPAGSQTAPGSDATAGPATKPGPGAARRAEPSADEMQAVADALNKYYTYISDPNSLAEIKKATVPLKGRTATASNEELNQLVAALPLGFQYFDTSTPDNIKNAYAQLFTGALVTSGKKMQVTVPASAISFDGANATVRVAEIRATVDGKKARLPITESLKLKKNDSGSWVIIPESQTAKTKDTTKK